MYRWIHNFREFIWKSTELKKCHHAVWIYKIQLCMQPLCCDNIFLNRYNCWSSLLVLALFIIFWVFSFAFFSPIICQCRRGQYHYKCKWTSAHSIQKNIVHFVWNRNKQEIDITITLLTCFGKELFGKLWSVIV